MLSSAITFAKDPSAKGVGGRPSRTMPPTCSIAPTKARQRAHPRTWSQGAAPIATLVAASDRHRQSVRRRNAGHHPHHQSHAEKMPRFQDAIPGDPQRVWQRRANPVFIDPLHLAPESTNRSSSILGQGCAGLARDRGCWSHIQSPRPGWIASPNMGGFDFRQAQVRSKQTTGQMRESMEDAATFGDV